MSSCRQRSRRLPGSPETSHRVPLQKLEEPLPPRQAEKGRRLFGLQQRSVGEVCKLSVFNRMCNSPAIILKGDPTTLTTVGSTPSTKSSIYFDRCVVRAAVLDF